MGNGVTRSNEPRWLTAFLAIRPWIALITLAVSAWAWWTLNEIERAAFRQPMVAVGAYRYPAHIKSGVFFLTLGQDWLRTVAHFTFFAAWLVGVALLIGGSALKRRYTKTSSSRLP